MNTEKRLTTDVNQYCRSKDKTREDITAVWLGKSSNDLQEKLGITLIKEQVKQMKVFNDIDDCVDCITSLEGGTVLFIVSHIFKETIVPLVNEISSIAAIYIYCDICSAYETWNNESYKKVVGVFNTQNQLISAIHDRTKDYE